MEVTEPSCYAWQQTLFGILWLLCCCLLLWKQKAFVEMHWFLDRKMVFTWNGSCGQGRRDDVFIWSRGILPQILAVSPVLSASQGHFTLVLSEEIPIHWWLCPLSWANPHKVYTLLKRQKAVTEMSFKDKGQLKEMVNSLGWALWCLACPTLVTKGCLFLGRCATDYLWDVKNKTSPTWRL